ERDHERIEVTVDPLTGRGPSSLRQVRHRMKWAKPFKILPASPEETVEEGRCGKFLVMHRQQCCCHWAELTVQIHPDGHTDLGAHSAQHVWQGAGQMPVHGILSHLGNEVVQGAPASSAHLVADLSKYGTQTGYTAHQVFQLS